MSIRRLLPFCLALAAVTATAAVDPVLFRDLHWRNIGPFRGGRALAVSGVPGEPEHFYFGSVNGGVWETRDAGRTWQPIFDGQPIGSIGAIAVAPSNPRVLYAGSGEADMRSDISQGDGMYKSADGGKTWSHIGLTDSQQIGRVVIHPDNPDVAYVAALGHPYAANAERGVFRTTDGGATWQKVLGPNNDTGAIDLALEPGNPKTIYAALWATRRTPWSVYPASTMAGSGIFKSTDSGDHWTQLTNGLPAKPGRIGLAVAPSQPSRVYAVVDAEEGGGMYRSDDAGATWTKSSGDARVWSRGWYFGGVTVEPKNADTVYSINVNVYRSDDAGKTFIPVKGAPGGDDYHTLWIDPQRPEHRILGVDQGVVVSLNGGKTWSSWFNQSTAQIYHVVTDNRFPYWVYGSQQDSGAAGVPSRTNTYDGVTLEQFKEITAGGESDEVAPDPKDPEILYGGRVVKLDLRTMQTQSIDPSLAYPENDRHTWTLPLIFSPRDPHVLYFSTQRMFRTDDGGNHWTVISPDLTRENPGTPANLDPVTAALKPGPTSRLGVIYTIAPSRTADHDLWAGTDDGQIWRTKDEGAHWTNITPSALTPWSKVGIIDASHYDAETAYASVDRHRLDDTKPYIYRTHDGGKSWQSIVDGIPSGVFVNAVREDNMRRGMLYAATEKGMYLSYDDGDHWQSLQLNLPVTSVRDIEVHGNDLVIATHGRGFWILDDITPLRDATSIDSSANAYLYKPATAVRFRQAGFTGSPMPKDEPMAANPPSGAYIDYVLKATPAAPVTLEILDEHDALVRKFISSDAAPQPNLARLNTAPEWSTPPPALSAAPGMHRFVWNLQWAGGREGGRRDGGIFAPPGNYKIALTVDGQKLTQPLTIAPDPRSKLPLSAYQEQFALAKQVETLRKPVTEALDEAEKAAAKLANNQALLQRVVEVSGIINSPNAANLWWLPPKTTKTLRFLDGALQRLAGAVDSADAAPTADARAAYTTLQPEVEAGLKAWAEVKAQLPK
jgi:photosystem II stability/assembly factor-like uncharacterized protein